jgi:uncharacterized membrane protein required for colicin V production
MWVDGLALALAALLGFLGFRRGALASALRVASLLGAYACSFLFAPRLGPRLAAAVGLPDLIGVAAVGLAIFLFSYLVLLSISALLRRRDEARRYGRSLGDRLGGAAIGVGQAGLIALLLGLLAGWLDAGHTLGVLPELAGAGSARVTELSRTVIEGAGSAVIGEHNAGARVALHLATRPAETLVSAQRLLDRAELRELQGDELFWTYVENEQIEPALNSRSFLAISYRRELRRELAGLGMVDPRGVEDAAFFREEMRGMLTALAPRVRALRRDPELARLASDPEITEALARGDRAALLTHPGVRLLVQRVLAAPAQQTEPPTAAAPAAPRPAPAPAQPAAPDDEP